MKQCLSLSVPSCKWAGCEPDDDVVCYHPSIMKDNPIGRYVHSLVGSIGPRDVGGICGPEAKLWEIHPTRTGHDKEEE